MTKHDKFRDREYRASYAESFLDTSIATQIRVLREQRGMTQADLAEATGMRQSRISALEDANYSRWSIGTLKRLARAFDIPLSVLFGTFGSLLADVDALSRHNLERLSFADDPALAKADIQSDRTTSSADQIQTGGTGARILAFQPRRDPIATTEQETTTDTVITQADTSVGVANHG